MLNNLRPLLKIPSLFALFFHMRRATKKANKAKTEAEKSEIIRGAFKRIDKFFNLNVEVAGVPLRTEGTTWFMPNHLSSADFVAFSSLLDASIVMKGDFFKLPLIGSFCKAAGVIGTRQNSENKGHDMAKFINTFNGGRSVLMFPEGTMTDGKQVLQFSAGLLSLLFGEAGQETKFAGKDAEGKAIFAPVGEKVHLQREVLVQPVVVRVREVNGRNVEGKPEQWVPYTTANFNDSAAKRIWNLLKATSITVELTGLPVLNPKDFKDGMELANTAHAQITALVAPDQKGVVTRKQYREMHAPPAKLARA